MYIECVGILTVYLLTAYHYPPPHLHVCMYVLCYVMHGCIHHITYIHTQAYPTYPHKYAYP